MRSAGSVSLVAAPVLMVVLDDDHQALRLLLPASPDKLARALAGVDRALVVEQTHGRQFHRYLRA